LQRQFRELLAYAAGEKRIFWLSRILKKDNSLLKMILQIRADLIEKPGFWKAMTVGAKNLEYGSFLIEIVI
jgi:hypothetical protein